MTHEAMNRMRRSLRDHTPWFVGGSEEAENEAIAAIEAEAAENERNRIDKGWAGRVQHMKEVCRAEAVAAERARIRAAVEAEPSEHIEDDGNIGRRAYGSLGIKPSGSGYIEVVGRAAVLRIIEGGSE